MEWVSNAASHDISKTTKPTMKKRYRPNTPTARDKLNSSHVIGVVAFAAILGAMTGSWLVFLLTAGILTYLAINSGDIRLKGRR